MRLTHQSLSGLLFATIASVAFTAPALAGEPAPKSESSTMVAQQSVAQAASAEEAVQKVRDVYSKICSTKNRAAAPAPRAVVPQPMSIEAPMQMAPMPQMW